MALTSIVKAFFLSPIHRKEAKMEFNLDTWKQQLSTIPAEYLPQCLQAVIDEPKRRDEQARVEATEQKVAQAMWESHPELKPAFDVTPSEDAPSWVQPTGAHDAYPAGAIVSHGGKLWVNGLQKLNVWEPGNDGPVPTWQEVTTAASPADLGVGVAEFVQPTGVHDAYAKGDQVLFEGVVYESTIDANTYSPTAYPAGWKQINSPA